MNRSNVIDERVVEMKFDNKEFESNVKESISTIDKLKKKLDFSKTSSGISAFEVATITAIANISNRITDLGINLVKSLSVDNIAAGWEKYNEQIKATGTLMSQGIANEETINKQLENLQYFADETSYSFDSMYNSVTKFTASGVSLEDSVTAVEGIAGWAAKAGQNAQIASNAMYQLSQAVAAGTVRLQDYRSIQTANMDTQEFRNTVLETAAAAGELYETLSGEYITKAGTIFTAEKGFTESLSQGWFTSDVLVKTLNKYSSAVKPLQEYIEEQAALGRDITTAEAIEELGYKLDDFGLESFKAAQEARTLRDAIDSVKEATASGWKSIFKNIFGDYEEAKKLWTEFADELWEVFVQPLTGVAESVSKWRELGGFDDLFERTEETSGAFWNLFDAIRSVGKAIKDAWKYIFPVEGLQEDEKETDAIGRNIKTITNNLKEFTSRLILTEEKSKVLSNIFKGIFSIFKAFSDVIKALWNAFEPILEVAFEGFSYLIKLVSNISEKFADLIRQSTWIRKVGEGIAKVLRSIINGVKSLFDGSTSKNLEKVSAAIETVNEKLEDTEDIFDGKFGEVINNIRNWLLKEFPKWEENITKAFDGFEKTINENILPALKSVWVYLKDRIWPELKNSFIGVWTWLKDKIWPLVEQIWPALKKIFIGLGNVIANTLLPTLIELLNLIGTTIEPLLSNIINIFATFGKTIFNFINNLTPGFKKLGRAIEILGEYFSGVFDSFASDVLVFAAKLKSADEDTLNKLKEILKWVAIIGSIFIIAKKLSDMAWSIATVINPLHQLFSAVEDFLYRSTFAMVMASIGYALKGLAEVALALVALSALNAGAIWKGGLIIAGILAAILGMVAFINKLSSKGDVFKSKNILAVAAMLAGMGSLFNSFKSLALTIIVLGSLDTSTLYKGVLVIATLMMIIGAFIGFISLITGKSDKGLSSMNTKFSIGKGKGINFSNKRTISQTRDALNGVMSVALGIFALALALKIVANIDETKLGKSLHILGVLSAILLVFVSIVSLVNKNAKNNGAAGKAIKSTLNLSLSLIVLALTLKSLANIDGEVFKTGVKRLSMLLTILALFLAIVSLASIGIKDKKTVSKSIKSLISLTAVIYAIIGVIKVITNMQESGTDFKQSLLILGSLVAGLLVFLITVSLITKYLVTTQKATKRLITMMTTLLMFVGAIGLLVGEAYLLKDIGWDSLSKLGAIMVVLGGILVGFSFLAKSVITTEKAAKRLITMMTTLLMFVGAIGLLVGEAYLLKGVEWQWIGKLGVLAGGALLALLSLVGIAALLAPVIAANIVPIIATLGSLGVFIAEIAELSWALMKIKDPIIEMGKNSDAMSSGLKSLKTILTLMLSIAAIFAIAGLVPGYGLAAAGSGLVGLAAFILTIAELSWALNSSGGLANILKEWGDESVAKGAENLTSLLWRLIAIGAAATLGTFGLVSLALAFLDVALLSWAIKDLGTRLKDIAEAFVMFNSVNTTTLANVVNNFINLIDGIGFWDTLFMGSVWGKIHDALYGIYEVIDLFKDIKEDDTKGMSYALDAITDFVDKYSDSGNFFSRLFGTDEWSKTSKNLKTISEGLSDFGKALGTIKANATVDINGIMSSVMEAPKTLSQSIESYKNSIINTLTNLALEAITALTSNLEIDDTGYSNVFYNIGVSMMYGLRLSIEESSTGVIEAIRDTFSDIMFNIQDIIDTMDNPTLTITPVLDLSEIQNESNQMYGIVRDANLRAISGSNNIAYKTSRDVNRNNVRTTLATNTQRVPESGGVINNTFNINGTNAKEIADEVAVRVQRQINRRNARWGQ